MSSAILYVAIVAIWACVLIPRWLHRGTTAENPETENLYSERSDPSPQHSLSPDVEAETAELADPAQPEPEGDPRDPRPRTRLPRTAAPRTAPQTAEARQRMLAARRRLLLMLLGLQVAAVILTVASLAAAWVLIPPTVMLAGYLLLLREAAHADAERAARQAEAEAGRSRPRAEARPRVRERQAAPAPEPAAPAPPPEPAPEDYSDLDEGRDYAPGLAGKYATSNSEVIDMYEYKRAVGD